MRELRLQQGAQDATTMQSIARISVNATKVDSNLTRQRNHNTCNNY